MANFQNRFISRIFDVFSRGFLHRTTLMLLQNVFFARLWHFLFFNQSEHFAKALAFAWAIAFARWPISKIVSFFEYLVFFECFFPQNNTNVVSVWFFALFLHFAKATAFAWAMAFISWPIFKTVSFFEYLVLFGAVFCTEQL